MFSGIVSGLGTVRAVDNRQGDRRLYVHASAAYMTDVQLGDSVATNGVCLTVVDLPGDGYGADVSSETLAHTTLSTWQPGTVVNLEKALMPTARLGGHLTSGHVDGVGQIASVEPAARSTDYWVTAPASLARYIARKGSISVDGISLTVNAVDGATFALTIVPHTQAVTNVNGWQVGSHVNLEVDIIARYLERLLDAHLPKDTENNASP